MLLTSLSENTSDDGDGLYLLFRSASKLSKDETLVQEKTAARVLGVCDDAKQLHILNSAVFLLKNVSKVVSIQIDKSGNILSILEDGTTFKRSYISLIMVFNPRNLKLKKDGNLALTKLAAPWVIAMAGVSGWGTIYQARGSSGYFSNHCW